MTLVKTFRRRARDESGASLILALVFILVTSVTVLSLSTLASNGLNSVAKFRTPQLARSAVNSAMTTAVDEERYTVTPASVTSPPALCTPSVTIPESNQSYTFAIWCSTTLNLGSKQTRTVTFTACPSTSTQTNCSSSQLLVAVVIFDDYTYPVSQILTSYCTKNCGTAEKISSWVLY